MNYVSFTVIRLLVSLMSRVPLGEKATGEGGLVSLLIWSTRVLYGFGILPLFGATLGRFEYRCWLISENYSLCQVGDERYEKLPPNRKNIRFTSLSI